MKKLLIGIFSIILGFVCFSCADGIYWDSIHGYISIVYNNGTNTITLQDKNLGATCTDISSSCSYGYYFQWGNNYAFVAGGNYTTNNGAPNVNWSDYGPSNYYNSNGVFYGDMSSDNYDLWGGVTGTPEAMQGPCPNGYHIIDNRQNLISILSSIGISSSSSTPYISYLKMPIGGYLDGIVGSNFGTLVGIGQYSNYWGSTSYSTLDARRFTYNETTFYESWEAAKSYGFTVRCFKNLAVSPDYTWGKLYGDTIEAPKMITVSYNSGQSVDIICDGENSIQINGLSTMSNNVFTPYYNISYKDEDNQLLVESYSKDILYLNGLFKKTYTGDNNWILTAQGGSSDNTFTGYVPVFDFTGDTIVNSGNVFNNFSDNALKVLLSNIPSYIQYITIFVILIFLFSFLRRFKRKS